MGNDTCTGWALYLAFHDSNEMMRRQVHAAPCLLQHTLRYPLNNHSCEIPHCIDQLPSLMPAHSFAFRSANLDAQARLMCQAAPHCSGRCLASTIQIDRCRSTMLAQASCTGESHYGQSNECFGVAGKGPLAQHTGLMVFQSAIFSAWRRQVSS